MTNEAKKLWAQLGNIPVDEHENLDQEFAPTGFNTGFEIGTHREDVWHWFEETFNLSVTEDLMGHSVELENELTCGEV